MSSIHHQHCRMKQHPQQYQRTSSERGKCGSRRAARLELSDFVRENRRSMQMIRVSRQTQIIAVSCIALFVCFHYVQASSQTREQPYPAGNLFVHPHYNCSSYAKTAKAMEKIGHELIHKGGEALEHLAWHKGGEYLAQALGFCAEKGAHLGGFIGCLLHTSSLNENEAKIVSERLMKDIIEERNAREAQQQSQEKTIEGELSTEPTQSSSTNELDPMVIGKVLVPGVFDAMENLAHALGDDGMAEDIGMVKGELQNLISGGG